MKKRTIRTCALIQAAALSLLCMSSAVSSYTDDGNEGVVDPVFIKAVEVPSDGGINDIIYVDEFGNLVEFDLIPDIQRADCSIPRYNLYDDNRVTSVKNQGMEGLCWAFAGMSSVESNLITKGLEPSDVDLSEKYMAWFANGAGPSDESDPLYGDISKELGTAAYDTGGNIYNVVSLLARGSGPVYEALVPQSTKTALSEDLRYKSLYQLENMTLYDPADITSIKNAVSENGAVYLSFCSDDLYLNSTTNGYYCSTKKDPNHGVSIVGWDDTFSKENFTETPSGDGAWIVKNSWGTSWGDNGIFYLSYYDATIKTVGSFEMDKYGKYDNRYQYDGNFLGGISYSGNSAFANIFTADSDEELKAVSFWTADAETPYVIKIYMDVNETPSDGTLVYTQNGTLDYAGYHKIDLKSSVTLDEGCRYSVVIELLKSNALIALDSNASGSGVSFYSSIYSYGYYWVDSINNDANVCIKAFTSERNVTGVHIDETTFPDSTFRTLISAYDTDNNEYLSDSEIASIEILDVSNQGITKLDGIEYLTSLTGLNCKGNSLIRLDLTKNVNIDYVECSENKLTELLIPDVETIGTLYCNKNNLVCFNLNNTEVTSFSMEDNVRNIGAVKSEFDMSGFKGFDPSKVSRWSGAEYDAEKNVFTDFTALTVTYSYYCGQTKYVTVTLQADSVEDMYMTIDECIDYVNAIDLSDTCTELSDKQLKAIERVLEYDYSK